MKKLKNPLQMKFNTKDNNKFSDDMSVASMGTVSFSSRKILWCTLAFTTTAIIWAYFAKVDEVAVGEGKVIPSQMVQVIQNLEGGIIKKINVKEGNIVNKDQVLMEIDDTRFSSTLGEGKLKSVASHLQVERLKAELADLPFVVPEDLQQKYPGLIKSEIDLYKSRKSEFQTKLNILNKQVTQKERELIETQAKQAQLQKNIDILKKELGMLEELVPAGLVSKVRLYKAQRELNDIQSELDNNRLSIPRLESTIAEANQKMVELTASFKTESLNELNKAEEELEKAKQNNNALTDQVDRTLVRSPVRGTVKTIHVSTIGGVVKPGMDLIEVVPLDDTLLIEAKIRPADVAFLHPGLSAMVKVTAYDFSIYGGLPAKLEHISADTITDDKDQSYYLIRVRTDSNYLHHGQEKLSIIPGMMTTVDIMTGKKSVLDYLLKPILKAKAQALRER